MISETFIEKCKLRQPQNSRRITKCWKLYTSTIECTYTLLWNSAWVAWDRSACLSVCISTVCLSVCLSVRLSFVCFFVCLSVCLFVRLSVCPYACLSVCFICLCVRQLSVCAFFCLSNYLKLIIYILTNSLNLWVRVRVSLSYFSLHFLLHFWLNYSFDRDKIVLHSEKTRIIVEKSVI